MTPRFFPAIILAMGLTVGAGGLISASAQTDAAVSGSEDVIVPGQGGWETYINGRFGTQISYPADVFRPGEAQADGDGRSFSSQDAQLEVFGFDNPSGETARSLRDRLVGSQGYEDVTYTRSGSTWLVLSGFRGDRIFYEKYFFRGGTIQAFGLEFPSDAKPFYAPIVEALEDTFRAG